MKKIMLSAGASLVFGLVSAQKIPGKEVPSVILNNFETKFRTAEDITWKRKGGNYEVEFEMGSRDFEIKYDFRGNKLYYKEELDVKTLPGKVRAVVLSNYPGSRITSAERVDNGQSIYIVEISDKKKDEWVIVVSNVGQILSRKQD